MEYVEAEGNSIDEAIERAVKKLGVAREKVDVDIIANATKGLFGIGGKKAKVRATLRAPLALHDAAPPTQSKDPAKTEPAPRPQSNRSPEAKKPASEGRQRSRPAEAKKPASDRPRRAQPQREAGEGRPPVEIDDTILEHVREVLEKTVQLIGTAATVRVVKDDLGTTLMVDGDESGLLIGRRGQTLDALEYMINRVASRDTGHTTHLVVDSHGYRQRRREALETLAKRMGERAEERGKTVTMNPMSPRDRRIVHLALEENPGLETRSSGNGYFRKLLIVPAARRRAES